MAAIGHCCYQLAPFAAIIIKGATPPPLIIINKSPFPHIDANFLPLDRLSERFNKVFPRAHMRGFGLVFNN